MTNYKGETPVRVIRGLSGDLDEEVATSYLNNGAVEGFPDDVVMEYTTRFTKDTISKKRTYRLPPATVGVTQSLVECQRLVADSIAAKSRETFLQGLYAYPMCRSRKKVEEFFKKMIEINRSELPDYIL
jgi:alpha-galactosidase/6-phospho-beta-glucosidase family protein